MRKYLLKLLGSSCVQEVCVFSIYYSTIYLYQYGLIDICFILCVIIQYCIIYLLLKLFQLWPLGTISGGSCVTLTLFCYLNTSLLFGATRCSRLILYISCPNPSISISPRSPSSFSQRMLLENKIWVLGVLVAGCLCFQAFSEGKPKKLTYVLTSIIISV